MLLKQQTNHLFYGKWPYKITCRIHRIWLIRNFKNSNYDNFNTSLLMSENFDLKNFLTLAECYIRDETIKKRIERNNIDFYILDLTTFENVQKDLNKYITATSSPNNLEDLQIMLENCTSTLCTRLPHEKYRYKVVFKDMPAKTRNNLLQWAEKYNNDDIYITKSTKSHFRLSNHHYGTHYFYVKDKKMIILINLAASGYIRRTEEFILKTDINNS